MSDFLKTALVVIAGFLGVLAAATDSRDSDTKRITRWGFVLIGSIVASTLLSLWVLWYEVKQQALRDAAAARQFSVAISKHELTLQRLAALVSRQEHVAGQT
jgi:hypothetical protein